MIRIKRIYEAATDGDGHRVLVDRLWPRGIKRDAMAMHEWVKAIAPSTDLREWYRHEPGRWDEFQRRYRAELATPAIAAELERLAAIAAAMPLTLLTATRDEAHSQAVVLRDVLHEGGYRSRVVAPPDGGR